MERAGEAFAACGILLAPILLAAFFYQQLFCPEMTLS
jgi:hypothetical protein